MKKKNGFTLIELLAVVIILGILVIIAIPAVTTYISDSRKSAYINTAKELVADTRNLVNSGKLEMYDINSTYYVPSNCAKTENGIRSPYGEFTQAYVGVIYNGMGYKYYWISVDETGQGIRNITPLDMLDEDDIESNLKDSDIENVVTTTGIGNRNVIKILNCDTNNWDIEYYVENISNNASETNGGGVSSIDSNQDFLYFDDSYFLTTNLELYHYDINSISIDETIPATLKNLSAVKVASNVKHFRTFNYYLSTDNKLYNLNDSKLILENVKDIFTTGYDEYALTGNNQLYFIRYGEAIYVTDNVSYVCNANGKLIVVNNNGAVDLYTMSYNSDSSVSFNISKRIFDGKSVKIYYRKVSNDDALLIKDDIGDYYLAYLTGKSNVSLVKLNDLKYVFSKSKYYTDMAITKNNTLIDLTNPSFEIEEPVLKNMTYRTLIVDKNKKLYFSNNGITDSGVTIKSCSTYGTSGLACIDKDGYLYYYLSNKMKIALYCVKMSSQPQLACPSDTTSYKASRVGKISNRLFVETTSKSIYELKTDRFEKSTVSSSSIKWLSNVIGDYSPNTSYGDALNVNQSINLVNNSNVLVSSMVNYYSNNIPNDSYYGNGFSLIKTDDVWEFTHFDQGGTESA